MKKWEEEKLITYQDLVQEKAERREVVKSNYKIFLLLIKYTPLINLFVEIIFSSLSYFEIDCFWIGYISSTPLISFLLLLIGSYVFKFCTLYRITLYCIVFVNKLAMYDTYIGIPLNDLQMYRIYLIILLIGLISYLRFHVKNNKKSSTKNSR